MVCQVDEEEELYPIVRPLFVLPNSSFSHIYLKVPPGKALHELTMHPSLPFVQI